MQRQTTDKEVLSAGEIQKAHVNELQWAVGFIQQDLRELRAGEWLSLKEKLYDFTVTAEGVPSTKKTEPTTFDQYDEERFTRETSMREVREIQGRMIQLFNALVHRSAVTYSLGARAVAFAFHASSLRSPFVWGFTVRNKIEAAVVALGTHLVGSMLTQEQFLRCPECGTVFISNRKPRPDRRLHCSTRCSRGAASRRYRNKPQGQRRERERAKRRYKSKIREKWPHATIAERRGT